MEKKSIQNLTNEFTVTVIVWFVQMEWVFICSQNNCSNDDYHYVSKSKIVCSIFLTNPILWNSKNCSRKQWKSMQKVFDE